MNTRQVNSAAGVILAALQQNRTATGIALALESAGLLMSPEAAADLASVSTDAVALLDTAVGELKREHEISAQLRARVAELEAQREADHKTWQHDLRTARDEREATAARLAELEAERHTTNEALADVTLAQRAAESADRLTAFFAPVASLREEPVAEVVTPRVQAMRALLDGQRAAVEDPHDGPLHHSYRVPRDLPQLGGA